MTETPPAPLPFTEVELLYPATAWYSGKGKSTTEGAGFTNEYGDNENRRTSRNPQQPHFFFFKNKNKSPPHTAIELFNGHVAAVIITLPLTQKGTLRISELSKETPTDFHSSHILKRQE